MRDKNIIVQRLLLALLVMGTLSAVVLAQQKAERITFKESPAIVWEQAMARNGSKTFVFAGKKGQTLKISFIEDNGKGQIEFEGRVVKEGFDNGLEIVLTETKDYSMVVTNAGNKASSFRISMTLEAVSPPKAPPTSANAEAERIKFPKGATATKWDVKVPANSGKRYVLGAKSGQTIKVSFLEDTKKGTLDFGKQSVREGLENELTMKLPATKDYILSISNQTNKTLTFTVFVAIE